MPASTCPFCHVTLFDGELAAGECTSCMQKLPQRGRDATEALQGTGWQGVRDGVGVLALATVAEMVLAPLLITGAWVQHEYFRFSGGFQPLELGLLVGVIALMVAGVIGLVGLLLTLSAPAHSGLRKHAVGSVVLAVLGAVGLVSAFVLAEITNSHPNFSQFEWLLILVFPMGVLLLLGSVVWYNIYLSGVARSFREETLGVGFISFGVAVPVLCGLGLLGVLLLQALRLSPADSDTIGLLGSALGVFVLLFWFAIMLVKLYRAIPRAGRRTLPPVEDE